MKRVARLVILLAATLSMPACDDEKDPVDIPFDGIEVSGNPDNKSRPPPTTDDSATATPKGRRPRSTGAGTGGNITGCCAALSAKSAKSTEGGAKAMYKQAASVCFRKSKDVRAGKLTRAQALSQVRSALLEAAPAACR